MPEKMLMVATIIVMSVIIVGVITNSLDFIWEKKAVESDMIGYAIIRLPDDTCVRGNVRRSGWGSSGIASVVFTDGTEYTTHANNVVIIS